MVYKKQSQMRKKWIARFYDILEKEHKILNSQDMIDVAKILCNKGFSPEDAVKEYLKSYKKGSIMNLKPIIDEVTNKHLRTIKAETIDTPSECMKIDLDRKKFLASFNDEIKAALYTSKCKEIKSTTDYGEYMSDIKYSFEINETPYIIDCSIDFTNFKDGKYAIAYAVKNINTKEINRLRVDLIGNDFLFEDYAKNKFIKVVFMPYVVY